MISPTYFLAAVLTATAVGFFVQMLVWRIHRTKLMNLAREWKMHYAHDDRFNLAPKVAERLTTPGAADVYVVDLIYGINQGCRRYIFSAHYTVGVVRWKRRVTCVATISENCGCEASDWSGLVVAPGEIPVMEQYKQIGLRT